MDGINSKRATEVRGLLIDNIYSAIMKLPESSRARILSKYANKYGWEITGGQEND